MQTEDSSKKKDDDSSDSPLAALALRKALQADGEGWVSQRCISVAQVPGSCLLQLRLCSVQKPVLESTSTNQLIGQSGRPIAHNLCLST